MKPSRDSIPGPLAGERTGSSEDSPVQYRRDGRSAGALRCYPAAAETKERAFVDGSVYRAEAEPLRDEICDARQIAEALDGQE